MVLRLLVLRVLSKEVDKPCRSSLHWLLHPYYEQIRHSEEQYEGLVFLSETNCVFSCHFLCRNRINSKAVLFTLQKYVPETKIMCLLCMQHKEQKILHYCVSYGKLMSHLCILVLPIHFKCLHGYTHSQHMYPHTCTYVCIYVQQLKELYCKLRITKCSICLKQKVSPIWKLV